MRAFPVAPLEVSARVSDLFTTVLARYGDLFVFRHTAGITESCLECILGSAEGENSALAHSYRLTVIRHSLLAVVGRIRPLADLLTVIGSKNVSKDTACQGSTICQGKQMSLFLFS